jgi:alkanesulfonate monooxygenase SsuD/methylene tetrahydromethanopterin reductase-like flavin-dependent oxidoreductase (luciferase family)
MRRLGLYLGRLPEFDKAHFDGKELIECVEAADACGYDSFWLPEAWERDAFTSFAEEADRVRELWQAGPTKEAIKAVTDHMVDAVAVCGSIERCRVRLDEMYANGADAADSLDPQRRHDR